MWERRLNFEFPRIQELPSERQRPQILTPPLTIAPNPSNTASIPANETVNFNPNTARTYLPPSEPPIAISPNLSTSLIAIAPNPISNLPPVIAPNPNSLPAPSVPTPSLPLPNIPFPQAPQGLGFANFLPPLTGFQTYNPFKSLLVQSLFQKPLESSLLNAFPQNPTQTLYLNPRVLTFTNPVFNNIQRQRYLSTLMSRGGGLYG